MIAFARRPVLGLVLATALGCTASTDSRHEAALVPGALTGQSAVSWRADLGKLNHPVTTSNAEAQKAFDEGLTLAYAFNHDEAIRSFQRAAQLDPNLAMAHWGVAYVLGPNYNMPVAPEAEKKAFAEVQLAQGLAKNASPAERDYIDALSHRYSNDASPDVKKLDLAYKYAMGDLSAKYPDDLDAATLYAESMMLLRPWHLWSYDGKPEEGTPLLVAVLESVLKRNPNHIGANHLYIHAIEASTHPEYALESAGRLPGLAPGAGHLVHMPAHIYSRTGDYEAAASSNEAAIEADRTYLKEGGVRNGIYEMMYFSHNMHFLAVADAEGGRFAEARKWADALAAHVAPCVKAMPPLEGFMPTPTLILVRFHRWDEVMKVAEPDKSMPSTHALWHFARGMALTAGTDLPHARAEHESLLAETQALPAAAMFSPFNKAHNVLAIADKVLAASIAGAERDASRAIGLLREGVALEDKLDYIEPPDWYLTVREALGGALMRAGQFADAEKVFREDLEKNPRSGRSLFGLMESLKAQGKTYDAQAIEPLFKAAWKHADTTLNMADF